MNWIRVTKRHPCRICRHDDWCGYFDEAAICMRVQSDIQTRNGGYLHKDDSVFHAPKFVPKPIVVEEPQIDFEAMFRRWQKETDHYHLDGFAMSLGVDTDALASLGCAWNGQAWGFPMKDAEGKIIGIRLRDNNGRKWAVRGSRSGLFLPDMEAQKILYILEGPTDTAAALSLGLYAIGRPSCLGCEEMVKQFIRNQKIKRVVIITDNDLPGLRGADKLQGALPVLSCQWSPFTKDLREFVNAGGTRQLIEVSIKDLVWGSAA